LGSLLIRDARPGATTSGKLRHASFKGLDDVRYMARLRRFEITNR
jgi:hypothetical protein